jgi:hypothetical protein
MDPITLAAAAVSMLVPFLVRVGGHVVDRSSEKLGDAAMEKLTELYEAFRARFRNDSYATALLRGVEDEPASTSRQQALELLIRDVVAQDQAFAQQLERLVHEAEAVGGTQLLVRDAGAVAGRDVYQRGHYVAGRDLNLGPNSPLTKDPLDED